MKVLVVLTLAVFTGCNANVLWRNQPNPQLDLVKDAFWAYVAKATHTAEETLQRIKQSELGQGVNTMISESTDAVNQYTVAMRGQVSPLTQDLLAKITQEAELLKAQVDRDLSTLKAELKPYAEELSADMQRQVDFLKKDMAPYVEALDSETLKAALVQKSEELRGNLEKSVKDLQSLLVPHAEEVKEELKLKMDQNLKAFQNSVVPLIQSFQAELAPYGEQLKKMELNAQDLKAQLAALWESFTQNSQ